jgi:hypothetical protein
METPVAELSQIEEDHGVVVGSILITGRGKKNIFGLVQRWTLDVSGYKNPEITGYSIEVLGEEEKIFVTEMPAGEYYFGELRIGNAYSHLNQRFTVHPGKTVYLGRLLIEFPGRGLGFLFKVEDAKEETLAAAEQTYGNVVRNVVTDLMGKITVPRTFDEVWYRTKALFSAYKKGVLAVGKDGLEFRGKKKQLAVPYSSVVDVRRATVGADFMGEEWAIVKFRVGGSEEIAAFMDPYFNDSQEIYKTLLKAYAGYDASLTTPIEPEKKPTEKKRVASVPKEVMKPVIPTGKLRDTPKDLWDYDIKRMIELYNFFEKDLNESGDFPNDFVDNGDGTITDRATGLMWEKGGSSSLLRYRNAQKYVPRLNRENFSGYSNWRMPTLEELWSLMEPGVNERGQHISSLFEGKQSKCLTVDPTRRTANVELCRSRNIVDFTKGKIDETATENIGHVHCRSVRYFIRAVRTMK